MEMLRIYPNKIPYTGDCLDWMESEIRPDFWTWHYPGRNVVQIYRREVPLDLEEAYCWWVVWLANEAMFDQWYQEPQTSHVEYQQVVQWCLATEKETGYFVPAPLTGMTVSAILADCGWFGLHWSRYPEFVIKAFDNAGWDRKPLHTDPRHPDYVDPRKALLSLSCPD